MKYLIVFFMMLMSLGALAQGKSQQQSGTPLTIGETQEIKSAVLGEARKLNIYLPGGYQDDTNKTKQYQVMYLLDGSDNEDFIHVTGVVQFLTMINAIPPTIVVGIANVDRKRDFTFPTTVEKDKLDYPTTGESAKFIQFLLKELVPFVKKNYRVSKSTLVGQSLGGLLATQVMLQQPRLFDQYIIVSPSLWWDNESLLTKTTGFLQQMPHQNMNVVVSVGAEGKEMEEPAYKLVKALMQYSSNGITTMFNSMQGETHLTILHNAVYQSLLKLNMKKG